MTTRRWESYLQQQATKTSRVWDRIITSLLMATAAVAALWLITVFA